MRAQASGGGARAGVATRPGPYGLRTSPAPHRATGDDYLLLKSLHLLGVVLFLGNIIVTAMWKVLADRTHDARIVAYGQRLVTITDIVFTATGALLILLTGMRMAPAFGGIGRPGWLTWGMGLFIASGVIWAAVLIPVQVMQARMARGFASGGEIPARYRRLSRIWMVFGVITTLLPLANLYFMVQAGVTDLGSSEAESQRRGRDLLAPRLFRDDSVVW